MECGDFLYEKKIKRIGIFSVFDADMCSFAGAAGTGGGEHRCAVGDFDGGLHGAGDL